MSAHDPAVIWPWLVGDTLYLGHSVPVEARTLPCPGRPDTYLTKVLSEFGGLRRSTTIRREAKANLTYLEDADGRRLPTFLKESLHSNPETERLAVRFIDDHYQGFGPKHSRNLLQGLGLSRFEIPIDSRITKWLNEFGFP